MRSEIAEARTTLQHPPPSLPGTCVADRPSR
jgi:hypothetical protein